MASLFGSWRRFSSQRVLISDLLHFAKGVPSVPVQRRMKLAEVSQARSACRQRPSWSAIFLKAFALVARENPVLRQTYMPFPWAHLYEHPTTVAALAVEREEGDEQCVVFSRIRSPERRSLAVIDRYVKRFKASRRRTPIARLGLAVAWLWWPIRLLGWWLVLNLSGYFRARYLGTASLTVFSSLGAESLHPISPLTATINYGVISPDGEVDVRIIYDHRVTDGATIARALAAMERVLNGAILEELRGQAPAVLPLPTRPVVTVIENMGTARLVGEGR